MNTKDFEKVEGAPHVPFWSVMVPTYNAPAGYLETALKSILSQDPGSEEMQIEVVDDCSPKVDVEALVKSISGKRVKFYKIPKNLGLADCWNMCIERSHGQWVHILHQDDLIKPGFYASLRRALEVNSDIGAAFCRHAFIDERGDETGLSDLESAKPGILPDFHLKLTRACRIQCASVVVSRLVYEQVGPFNPQFPYVLDWDMWLRISLAKSIWYEPRALACYRLHSTATTSSLQKQAGDVRDIQHFLKHAESYFQNFEGKVALAEARKMYAVRAIGIAKRFLEGGDRPAAIRQLSGAWRLHPSPDLLRGTAGFALRWLKPRSILTQPQKSEQ